MCGRKLFETQIAYPIRYGPYSVRLNDGREGAYIICQDNNYRQYLQIIDWQKKIIGPPLELRGYLVSPPITSLNGTIVVVTLPDRQITLISFDANLRPKFSPIDRMKNRPVLLLRGGDRILVLGIDNKHLLMKSYDWRGLPISPAKYLLQGGEGGGNNFVRVSEQTILLQWGSSRRWRIFHGPAQKLFAPGEIQEEIRAASVKSSLPAVALTSDSTTVICTWSSRKWRCQGIREKEVSAVYAGSEVPISPLFLSVYDPIRIEAEIKYYKRSVHQTSIAFSMRPKWIDGRRGPEQVFILAHSKKNGTQLVRLNFRTQHMNPCLSVQGEVADNLLMYDKALLFTSGNQLFVWGIDDVMPETSWRQSHQKKTLNEKLKIAIEVEASSNKVALNSTHAINITCRVDSSQGQIRLLSVADLAESASRKGLYEFIPPIIIDKSLYEQEKKANLQLVFHRTGTVNVFLQVELLDSLGNRYSKRLEPLQFEVYDARDRPPTYHFEAGGDMVVIQRSQMTDKDILAHL